MKPPVINGLSRIYNGPAPGWLAVSRGAALGLSALIVFNLLEVFTYSTSPVENWFVSFHPLPPPIALTVLTMAATALILFAIRPALPGPVWLVAFVVVLGFAGLFGRELIKNSQSLPESIRSTAMIQPLGIAMLFVVAGIGIFFGNSDALKGSSSFLAIVASAALTIVGFAVVTVQSGGLADVIMDKPVPAIVVLGCPLGNDGMPTEALVDRIATASQLLTERAGTILVLSGGDVASDSKSSSMAELALEAGASETSIVTDLSGQTGALSLQFAAALPELEKDRRVIVVSHWYELARLRILARRQGVRVFAVPANQRNALFGQNMLVAKEVAAFLQCICEPAVIIVRSSTQPTTPSGKEGVRSQSVDELDDFVTE